MNKKSTKHTTIWQYYAIQMASSNRLSTAWRSQLKSIKMLGKRYTCRAVSTKSWATSRWPYKTSKKQTKSSQMKSSYWSKWRLWSISMSSINVSDRHKVRTKRRRRNSEIRRISKQGVTMSLLSNR